MNIIELPSHRLLNVYATEIVSHQTNSETQNGVKRKKGYRDPLVKQNKVAN